MKDLPQHESPAVDIAQLVAEHQLSVWRYLRSWGCSPQEAEDLTQETFLKVLEKPFEQLTDAATRGYLRTVARNLLIDRRRREGRQTNIQAVENIDQFWVATDERKPDELLELLKECLDGLTERARMALQMRFQDRKSRSEIADALQIGEHGAKNLMQRAKQQLRECIEFKLNNES
ncbi:RNA polymerase sigma factor [Bremerella sp. P1]|uniref:RNA polymerase sigma factor n=1 Tax=Bremerella sp. P1 TaxID=3026424 RepID=UPI0023682775|nr:sigma-70 family RNA polymerase sigma factor [Bremerella sp. P1]WDI44715.1 sigma-70 family RNA polymerase sigma factor [Bremerella sp. P1]